MEIIIHQAILHVLDTTLDAPVLSGSCMEPTAEKMAYLQYHIEKLLASDDIRQCRPLPDSAFRNELEQNKDFVDLSCRIAGVLFDYMHAHTTIPGADLAVVDFTRDGEPWLGILKLNYRKIVHFGIQTAGFGDPLQTSQLTVCYADEHEMKFGFIGQEELLAVAKAISRCIL